MRSVFILLLVSLFFSTSVGIRVFTHSCEEDGIFKTYFVQVNNHCEEEERELPSCCKKEKEKEKKDCCQDETQVFKLKIDYLNFWDDLAISSAIVPQKPIFKVNGEKIQLAETHIFPSNSDPPPKPSGREILLQKNVLTI
jgi:hypothetical protein